MTGDGRGVMFAGGGAGVFVDGSEVFIAGGESVMVDDKGVLSSGRS